VAEIVETVIEWHGRFVRITRENMHVVVRALSEKEAKRKVSNRLNVHRATKKSSAVNQLLVVEYAQRPQRQKSRIA
jgi:hypothetical protein